jgi:hypothetical protein
MAYHVRFYIYSVKLVSIMHIYSVTDELRHYDHVSAVGSHWITGIGFSDILQEFILFPG